jgi:hypothetical protein
VLLTWSARNISTLRPISASVTALARPVTLPPYTVRGRGVDARPCATHSGQWKPTAACRMQSGQIGRPQRWQWMWVSRSACR